MDKSYTRKFKFIVKVLTILLVLNVTNSWGQAIIPISRTAWGTTPVGWTDNQGTGPTYASDICGASGASSGKLDNTGENFIVNYNAIASNLSFCLKGNAYVAGQFNIEESVAGAVWTNVQTITNAIPANGSASFTVVLNCTSRYVRFIYTTKTGGNIALDDVVITTGTCVSCVAPTTTISPTTQTVCVGSVTSYTVGTDAISPSYTWQASSNGTSGWASVVNGTPAGASYIGTSTNSLAITAGSTYYYQCLVTESNTCTAISATATLIVNTNPTITTQPINKTICSGSNTSFTVAASGTPLTYQWQEKVGAGAFANITNGGVYGGATTASLTLTNPGTGMNTNQYQCVVSVAGCSSATTTAAVLTVNTSPATPTTPVPAANPSCGPTTLGTLVPTGSETWYWQGTTALGVLTTSSTASTYAVPSTGTYYVRALDASGTCWSAAGAGVLVTVNTPITITTQPTDKEVCGSANTSFAIVGAGTAPKQWQYSPDGGMTFFNVVADAVYSNETTATLNLTAPSTALNGYIYQCVVSVPGCAVVTSSTAVLTVFLKPATPPIPTAINPACSTTTLAAMSSTVAGVTWYWQGTTAAGSSTTSPTSSPYNVSASGTYYVRARADGSSCLSASSSFTAITINQPPVIVTEPADRTICVGTNTTFVVSTTGTSLTYQWQVNTGAGFVNLTNTAPYSTVTSNFLTITGATAGMNGYQYQCVITAPSPCSIVVTSSIATLYILVGGAATVAASSPTTNAVGCNAFNISWVNGDGNSRLVVVSTSPITTTPVDGTTYAASSKFGVGATISAGVFAVYNGTGSSVFVYGLSASTTYYYAIFELNACSPVTYLSTGTIPGGSETTISCSSPAGATAVYIDACSGACVYEGNNELIWGTSGSYALKVKNNGPTLNYNSTTPPATAYISSYNKFAANITALNTAVGACGSTVFVDPNTQGFIPPNSKFLIANSCMCSPSAYDFSSLCTNGPIYVVFGTGPNWPCNSLSGIFGNKPSAASCATPTPRYFDLNFTAWGVPALDPIYSYSPCSLTSGADGDIVLFNPTGGAATTYSNSSCVVPLVVLPIQLLDIYATKNNKGNEVIWKVAQEENILYYTIEKSKDAIDFTAFATVYANNEIHIKAYSIFDNEPYRDITYYRLSTKEKNGTTKNYKIISVDEADNKWEYIHYQTENNMVLEFKNALPKNSVVSLYDISGKELITQSIKQSQTTINTDMLSSGVYFVSLSTPYKTEHFKIIISK